MTSVHLDFETRRLVDVKETGSWRYSMDPSTVPLCLCYTIDDQEVRTITFEDFNNTEKIATLPDELSTEGLPSGYTPEVGDFSYYAPWGNISVFYKDFRYSNSLYKLGRVESGIEILENMNGDFEVTIERVN